MRSFAGNSTSLVTVAVAPTDPLGAVLTVLGARSEFGARGAARAGSRTSTARRGRPRTFTDPLPDEVFNALYFLQHGRGRKRYRRG